MEIIMFTSRIEEALVRLEERALELTMAQPGDLALHEHDMAHEEAKNLRPVIDQMGGEYVRRLDHVQVELMCIRQRWQERLGKPQAA
jgi:hypothetical protein